MQEYTVKVHNDKTEWYQDGLLQREDGPAVEYADGYKVWYQNGKKHREDGPAIECPNGDKAWYQNGRYHRLDGPAVEYADGNTEWWIDNTEYTEHQFIKKTSLRELTVSEIEKLLGYPVKIISES